MSASRFAAPLLLAFFGIACEGFTTSEPEPEIGWRAPADSSNVDGGAGGAGADATAGSSSGGGDVTGRRPCTLPWDTSQLIEHGQTVTAYRVVGSSCGSEVRTCNDGSLSGSYSDSRCPEAAAPCDLPWGGQLQSGATATAYARTRVGVTETCDGEERVCSDGVLSGSYGFQLCTVDSVVQVDCLGEDGPPLWELSCGEVYCIPPRSLRIVRNGQPGSTLVLNSGGSVTINGFFCPGDAAYCRPDPETSDRVLCTIENTSLSLP